MTTLLDDDCDAQRAGSPSAHPPPAATRAASDGDPAVHGVFAECIAECVGTFVLVFFGAGAVHAAVLTGAQTGLWQVAVVWAVGISLAIYVTGAISGCHINPAVTAAMAVFRGFPPRKVAPYMVAQLVGAFLAAVVLYALFSGILHNYEAAHGIVRGMPGSERSAMVYGEYFPNPAILGAGREALDSVTLWQAAAAELIGTAFLVFFVFGLTDRRNAGRPNGNGAAVLIGLAVAAIVSVVAPLTQAGLNPARDFGPRLFAWLAGWKTIAIPGPRGGFFTVYVLAPMVGGLIGGGLHTCVLTGVHRKKRSESQGLSGHGHGRP